MKRVSLLSVLLLLPLSALAAPPKVASLDDSWLVAAHQNNLAEIQSGKLAAQSGHAAAVRAAGQMLAQDHAKLDAELEPVAKKMGVKLPKRPNPKQRNEMKQFQSKSGMKFDVFWTHTEADGHVKAIEMTEREIHKGSNPQVKQLAEGALPVLKKHLTTLKQALTKLSGSHFQ